MADAGPGCPPVIAAEARTRQYVRQLALWPHTHDRRIVGSDLKLFEPKTRCPFFAVRDREER